MNAVAEFIAELEPNLTENDIADLEAIEEKN